MLKNMRTPAAWRSMHRDLRSDLNSRTLPVTQEAPGFEFRRSRQISVISGKLLKRRIVPSLTASAVPSLPATFSSVLRLMSGDTYTLLRRMKPFGKVGVTTLSLLLLATPIMACLVPAAAMTASERDCCKRMAHQCGNRGMPQSHSCCQTTTIADHLAAIKSSSDVNSHHPTLFVAYAIHPGPTISTVSESDPSAFAADIHSPPVSPPVAISILRI